MNLKLIKGFLLTAMVLSANAFAQVATGQEDKGFKKYMNSLEDQALYGVGFIMVAMGVAGVVFAYMAVMTLKDNVSDSPQSGQPEWGKFIGQFIVAAATLGGSTWIYSVTEAFNGGEGDAGAGSKVRERYQGTGN